MNVISIRHGWREGFEMWRGHTFSVPSGNNRYRTQVVLNWIYTTIIRMTIVSKEFRKLKKDPSTVSVFTSMCSYTQFIQAEKKQKTCEGKGNKCIKYRFLTLGWGVMVVVTIIRKCDKLWCKQST